MLQNRGIYFHISWFFAYIRTADRQTGETYGTTEKDWIFFMDSIRTSMSWSIPRA